MLQMRNDLNAFLDLLSELYRVENKLVNKGKKLKKEGPQKMKVFL